MKLEEAITSAKSLSDGGGLELRYIAVDANYDIFGHSRLPIRHVFYGGWIPECGEDNKRLLGKYTDKEHWTKTLREVTHNE